jgi:hypothetical protein
MPNEAERTRARKKRLEDPQQTRLGTISAGHKVRYCRNSACRKPVPASETECPFCHGKDLGSETVASINYFRFVGFPEDIAVELKRKYGEKPTAIPFTFPGHPRNYIRIGYECYQGKSLHCRNDWFYNEKTGLWEDQNFADRRMKDGLTWKEIPCESDKCPYIIGGPDPYLDGKPIKPRQCGEHATMHIWLYDMPSLQLVRVKSGGTGTIENFITETKKIVALMGGRWQPVKLELRIKTVHRKYPGADGQLKSTDVPLIYIHFPKAITALGPGDVVSLPSQRAIPAHAEDNYDDLIDGARALPEPKEEKPQQRLTELKGNETLPPRQGEVMIDAGTLERIEKEISAVPVESTKTLKLIRRVFAFAKGQRFNTISQEKGERILKYLGKIKTNLQFEGPGDPLEDFEKTSYEFALAHPEDEWSEMVISGYKRNHPEKFK